MVRQPVLLQSDGPAAAESAAAPQAPAPPPSPREDRIHRALDRYCEGYYAGERPDVDSFCARYPRFKSSLKSLILAHNFVQEHPEYIRHGEVASCLVSECTRLLPRDGHIIPWPALGENYLGFVLQDELGRGAFARVFLAEEPALGNRQVAVKISQGGAKEAKTLGRLRHPNIVPVHSVHEERSSGLSLVCMPYLGGATLCDVLDRAFENGGPPEHARAILDAVRASPPLVQEPVDFAGAAAPWNRPSYVDAILDIAIQLADALAFIHPLGICHLDLKPTNVLISATGRAMLLDFNLSLDRQLEDQQLGGTLPYMSPEQLLATRTEGNGAIGAIDCRSDIFSVGVILYELLSGKHPFGELSFRFPPADYRDLLLEQQQQPHAPLTGVNPRVDSLLAQIVEACLAFAANDRPQSGAELAARLRKCRGRMHRARLWLGRHARPVIAAATLVLTICSAGAYGIAQREPAALRYLGQARQQLQAQNYKAAVARADAVLAADPQWQNRPDVFLIRARAHQGLGARAAADSSACSDPVERAKLDSLKQQEFSDARREYRQSLPLCPETPFAREIGRLHAAIAYCNFQTGELGGQIPNYERALAAGFVTAEVLNNLGFSYLQINRLQEAEKALEQSIQLNRHLQAPYHNRALLAVKLYQKALREEEAFFRSAGAADIWKALLLPVPRPEKGLADIQEALGLGDPTAEMHRDAAYLYALSAYRKPYQLSLALRRLEGGAGSVSVSPPNRNRSSFHLLYRAARNALLAVSRDDQAAARAIDHLHHACDLGQDVALLKNYRSFAPLLDLPAFRQRLKSRRVPVVTTGETRIVDPTLGWADSQ
ncbi:MAG TPA: serine/threonine-protein kinase [Gemmataceae bacterium]|nr:serine/threonine-protein kinase [Gemmataceae bacterium]